MPIHSVMTRNPLKSEGGHAKWRIFGYLLLACYTLAVLVIVFWPAHVDDNAGGEFVRSIVHAGHVQGWIPLWFSYQSVEWLSNVLMFTPGGFLLTLLLSPSARRWVPLCALGGTVAIECTQLVMPGRTSSVWDVVANTLGGTLGWLCALAILWVVYHYQIKAGEK